MFRFDLPSHRFTCGLAIVFVLVLGAQTLKCSDHSEISLAEHFSALEADTTNYEQPTAGFSGRLAWLRNNYYALIDSGAATEDEILNLNRAMWKQEAVFQVLALTGEITHPAGGVAFGLWQFCTAIDSAKAQGAELHEILQESNLLASKIANRLRFHLKLNTFEERVRLLSYIREIESLTYLDHPQIMRDSTALNLPPDQGRLMLGDR